MATESLLIPIKISALPAYPTSLLALNDILPVVQSATGTTTKATITQLRNRVLTDINVARLSSAYIKNTTLDTTTVNAVSINADNVTVTGNIFSPLRIGTTLTSFSFAYQNTPTTGNLSSHLILTSGQEVIQPAVTLGNTNSNAPTLTLYSDTSSSSSRIEPLRLISFSDGSSAVESNVIKMFAAKGSRITPSAYSANSVIGGMRGFPYNGTKWNNDSLNRGTVSILMHAAEDQSTTRYGSYITFNTTLTGSNTASNDERMRIASDGNVGIGTASPANPLEITSTASSQVVAWSEQASGSHFVAVKVGDFDNGPNYVLAKARGSYYAPSAVLANDTLGTLIFQGHIGGNYKQAASIQCGVDGTPSAVLSAFPSRLTFNTLSPGASTVTEKMRITSTGRVGIGTLDPTGSTSVLSSDGHSLHVYNNVNDGTSTNSNTVVVAESVNRNAYFLASVGDYGGLSVKSSADGRHFARVVANTGNNTIFQAGDGTVGGLVETMRILSGGNVGIGTSTPLDKLHLNKGRFQISEETGGPITFYESSDDMDQGGVIRSYRSGGSLATQTALSAGCALFGIRGFAYNGTSWNGAGNGGIAAINAFSDGAQTLTNGGGYLTFSTCVSGTVNNNQERMRIASNGFVGIGTSAPGSKLHVAGDIRVNTGGRLFLGHGDDGTRILRDAGNNGIALETGSTTRLFIADGGNVGIGTSTPRSKLDMGANVIAGVSNIRGHSNAGAYTIWGGLGTDYEINGGYIQLFGSAHLTHPNLVALGNSAGTKLAITSSGNVGIGTASPGAQLHVAGSTVLGGTVTIGRQDNGQEGGEIRLCRALDNTSEWAIDTFGNSTGTRLRIHKDLGGEKMTILDNGNIGIGLADPTARLHAAGSGTIAILAGSGAAQNGLVIRQTDASVLVNRTGYIDFRNENDRPTSAITSDTLADGSGNIQFLTTPAGARTSDRRGERLRITGDGRVGIGTTTPGSTLSVGALGTVPEIALAMQNSFVRMSQRHTNDEFGITTNLSTTGVNDTAKPSWGLFMGAGTSDCFNIKRGAAGSGSQIELMWLTSAGKLGVGTTTPTDMLHVPANDGTFSTGTRPSGWGGGITTWDIYAGGTIGTGSSTGSLSAYVNRDGNAWFGNSLGVGSSTLNYDLQISKNKPGSYVESKTENTSLTSNTAARYTIATGVANHYALWEVHTNANAPTVNFASGDGATSGMYFTAGNTVTTQPIYFRQGTAERLKIDSSGNTTVNGNALITGNVTISGTLNVSGSSGSSTGGDTLTSKKILVSSSPITSTVLTGFNSISSYNLTYDGVGAAGTTYQYIPIVATHTDSTFTTPTFFTSSTTDNPTSIQLVGYNQREYNTIRAFGAKTTASGGLTGVLSGESIFSIKAYPRNASGYYNMFGRNGAASISILAEGDQTNRNAGTKIQFATTTAATTALSSGDLTTRMTIADTGRVGIGTTTPTATLEVSGTTKLQGVVSINSTGTDYGYMFIGRQNDTGLEGGEIALADGSNNAAFMLDVLGSTNSRFRIHGGSVLGEFLTIRSSTGNIGIGTTDPTSKLHVSGGDIRIGTGNYLQLGDGTGTRIYRDAGNNGIDLQTASASRLFVTDYGSIGIGTFLPGAKLHVLADANTMLLETLSSSQETALDFKCNSTGGRQYRIGTGGSGGGFQNGGFGIYDVTAGSMRVLVTSAGNVGIGSFNPTDGLSITRDGNTQVNIERHSTDALPAYLVGVKRRGSIASSTTTNSGDSILSIQSYAYDGTADRQSTSILSQVDGTPANGTVPGRIVFSTTLSGTNQTPVERMRITSSGNVGIGTTTPNHALNITRDGTARHLSIEQNSTDSAPAYISGTKRRGTNASRVAVSNGDGMLSMQATAYDGTQDRNSASLEFQVDGTPANGTVPGRLVFYSTPAGTSQTLTERMRITSAGKIGIGTSTPSAHLHVVSTETGPVSGGVGAAVLSLHNSGAAAPFVKMQVAASAGDYNPMTREGDQAIIFSGSSTSNSNASNLVLAPWSTASTGVRITSAGFVGINTPTPSRALDVNGDAYFSGGISSSIASILNFSGSNLGGIELGGASGGVIDFKHGSSNVDSHFRISHYLDNTNNMECEGNFTIYTGTQMFNMQNRLHLTQNLGRLGVGGNVAPWMRMAVMGGVEIFGETLNTNQPLSGRFVKPANSSLVTITYPHGLTIGQTVPIEIRELTYDLNLKTPVNTLSGATLLATSNLLNVWTAYNVTAATSSTLTYTDTTATSSVAMSGDIMFIRDDLATLDRTSRTQTYIQFKAAGSLNDYALLRQIGGDNQYNLSFDLHDDDAAAHAGYGQTFSIRNVRSTSSPNIITPMFNVSTNSGEVRCGVNIESPDTALHVNGAIKGNSVLFANSTSLSSGFITVAAAQGSSLIIGNGLSTHVEVTVTGAEVGDHVLTSYTSYLSGINMFGQVRTTDIVRVFFQNNTGGSLTVPTGTIRVRVMKWL